MRSHIYVCEYCMCECVCGCECVVFIVGLSGCVSVGVFVFRWVSLASMCVFKRVCLWIWGGGRCMCMCVLGGVFVSVRICACVHVYSCVCVSLLKTNCHRTHIWHLI